MVQNNAVFNNGIRPYFYVIANSDRALIQINPVDKTVVMLENSVC